MKNQCLLILFLLSAFSAFAQPSSFTATPSNPPNSPPDCRCMDFNVPQPGDGENFFNSTVLVPGTEDPMPGYSYFWVWGDGSHSEATSVTTPHCFNGTEGAFNVSLHYTPRKKPTEQSPGIVSQSISVPPAPTCNSLPHTGSSRIFTNRELKLGKTFLVVIEAKACSDGSDFRLVFMPQFFEQPVDLPGGVSLAPASNELLFSQGPSEFKRYYIEFQCLPNSPPGTTIPVDATFNLIRTGQGNGRINKPCNQTLTLVKTITSGPFDPNAISASLGRNLANCAIGGQRIEYVVKFQNEGDDATNKVMLRIKLDPKFDETSFRIEGVKNAQDDEWLPASDPGHPAYYFEELLTNPSTHPSLLSGPESHMKYVKYTQMRLGPLDPEGEYAATGYVKFSVEVAQNESLSPGEELNTCTEVYFNDEIPVKTNDAITSCASDSSRCTGEDNCKCKSCCNVVWYRNYLWWLVGSFVLVILVFWYKKKK